MASAKRLPKRKAPGSDGPPAEPAEEVIVLSDDDDEAAAAPPPPPRAGRGEDVRSALWGWADADEAVALPSSSDEDSGRRGRKHYAAAGILSSDLVSTDEEDAAAAAIEGGGVTAAPPPAQETAEVDDGSGPGGTGQGRRPARTGTNLGVGTTAAAAAVAAKRSRLDQAMAAAAAAAAAAGADDEDDEIEEVGGPAGRGAGPSSRPPSGATRPSDAPITLRLVASDRRELTVRLRPHDTFAAMFAAFMTKAIGEGWAPAGSAARFVFDGEALSPIDTPAGADVEDGCAIDVFFS